MQIYSEVSPGAVTVYKTPVSTLTKFAKVAGTLTALASQSTTSVTFSTAPAAGAVVDIYYGNDIVLPLSVFTTSGVGGRVPPPFPAAGLSLILNCTAVSGVTPTLAVKVQEFDHVSEAWVDIPGASFASITAVGMSALMIFPGAVGAANASVNALVRHPFRIVYTLGGTAPSFTFSVGAHP